MKCKNVIDVACWRLCVGCGACAFACEKKNIILEDVLDTGIRPTFSRTECGECTKCIEVCPGLGVNHESQSNKEIHLTELRGSWGPVLEVWEGYANDTEIRYKGSSGGLASAIALYCLEKEEMYGVLHTSANVENPYKNKTAFSRNRSDILSRSGSRYSPASPCDGLSQIESAPNLCVFIGKPCDVAGLRKAQFFKPELDRKVGVAIGIFCAGAPSTQGIVDLLRNLNVNREDINEIRYRGEGWPGNFSVRLKGEENTRVLMTYMDSWGFVQKYRPYRCYLCPDGTSEFADISCGDPWHREISKGEQGYSLVLVRTEKGRKIIRGAMETGHVVLERVGAEVLEKSQKNLLGKRREIWGRFLAMKAFGIPTPLYEGFPLFENWRHLTTKAKARSILGTIRRIIKRKYYKPLKLV